LVLSPPFFPDSVFSLSSEDSDTVNTLQWLSS
jgi:hypothetical protein